MVTKLASGTQLATGGVDTLYSDAAALAKTLQVVLDLANMQAADAVTLTIEIAVRSGGTRRVLFAETFTDAQSIPDIIQISRPFPVMHEVLVTLEQTAGTNRNYDWSVQAIGDAVEEATGDLVLDGTEQTIATVVTNRVLALLTDHNAQVGGDTVRLRVKTRAIAGGTDQTAFQQSLSGALSAPDLIQLSVPVSAPDSFVATAEKTAGANHTIPYSVVSLAGS